MTSRLRGHDADKYRFVSTPNGLSGWVRKDFPEKFLAEIVRDPEGLLNRPSSVTVKDGPKTRVVRHGFQDQDVRFDVMIKRFHYGTGLRRLGFRLFPSPAIRCLRGALLLHAKDILVPKPLVILEYRDWKRLGTSYYVSEEVADSHSLHEFWQSLVRRLPPKKRAGLRRAVLRELARLLARLHTMGIYHRDLKTSNILIQGWAGEKRRLFLVDLDRVQERRRLSIAKRVKNLLQVRRQSPFPREQIHFIVHYAEHCCLSKKEAKALARRLLARSRRTEKRLEHQRKSVPSELAT